MPDVLIVESYRTLASLYREILEEEGHRVFLAGDGKEAMELARRRHIDVAVVEEGLLDMDAEELLKRLKALQPHMFGTICTVTDLRERARGASCDARVLKSSDFMTLQEQIKSLLEKSQNIPS